MDEERRDAAGRVRAAARLMGCTATEALALAVLAVGALAVLALLWYLQAAPRAGDPGGRPAPPALSAAPAGTAPPGTAPPGTGSGTDPASAVPSPSEVVVHLAGRVEQPGVYRVPAGSRVEDALALAGGGLPDAQLDGLNLARPLADGEQIVVPSPGAPPPPAGGGTGGGPARRPDGTLDLNLATEADLDELPGIGPVLASRIVDHRTTIGRFASVDELRDVTGIGEATFADLAAEVAV